MKRKFMNLLLKLRNFQWKDLGGHFIPILITLFTGVISFFIYSYFNREKVNIQSVLVRTKDLQLQIDLSLASKIIVGQKTRHMI
jgi:hypothetical protein